MALYVFNLFSPGMLFWKNFKWSDLKDQDEFRFKIRIFRKFIQFSSKARYFLCTLPTWVHGRRILCIQPPAKLLPGQQFTWLKWLMMTQKKFWILLFLGYFFLKWAETFNILQFFFLEKKQCPCLASSTL